MRCIIYNEGMAKHCATCKTVKDLMPQPYFRYTLKDGTPSGSYMCRRCNAERTRKYRKTPKGKASIYRVQRNQIESHPEKVKARVIFNKAIKRGEVKAPLSCSKCNKELRLDAHHPNYDEPLEVVWLCRRCHIALHREL